MTKPLLSQGSLRAVVNGITIPVAILFTFGALGVSGWTPRLPKLGPLQKGDYVLNDGVVRGQQIFLFMGKSVGEDGDEMGYEGDEDLTSSLDADGDFCSLNPEFLSRLETIYNMDTESIFGVTSTDTTQKSLWQEKERLVLGDWFEVAEKPCLDECCGDDCEQCDIPEEFKVDPQQKVDVMAFLGIKRAEPLRVRRDWD